MRESEFYSVGPDGIYRPNTPVFHRDEEYDQSGLDILFQMQEKHFWYRGRHRFLLAAFDRYTRSLQAPLSAVDLGGGVGGWVRYLADHRADRFQTLGAETTLAITPLFLITLLLPRI